ncbi:myb-related transcription factor, partner of profilin-like [Bufo bufo]|uniref:myb-related transcription factor, partner of profilin-like n=1 Tax=Bufo bufo TaxID=8384 RepID=UPI001ABDEE82|nr:myb-related transcription factor, partner of profilin-like [Bufo bufo]
MAPPKGTKKRKPNFVAAEMDILIAALQQHKEVLYGAQRANTTIAQRRAIYEAIALDINALGNEVRTWDDIQKKLNDMRRRVREKLALIRKHTGGTGGGPRCMIRLNQEEQLIAQTFVQEQVEGLEGYDSTVGNLGTGGDEEEEAGPSSAAARPSPSRPEPGVQSGPMDILAMLVQEEIIPGPSMEEQVSLGEISGNSKAIVTCLVALETTPALLSRMTAAVQANTAAVQEEARVTRRHQRDTTTRQMRMLAQTNTILARLANAMEGMQPPPARSVELMDDLYDKAKAFPHCSLEKDLPNSLSHALT